MLRCRKILSIASIAAFAVLVAHAQSSRPAFEVAQSDHPQFGVASVRVNRSGTTRLRMIPEGDRFTATNVTLSLLLQFAFRPANGAPPQMFGTPGWAETARFDIDAKAGRNGASVSRDEMQQMVQSLLQDRFQLKAHREPRELPVYDLVVTRGGLKMKLSQDQSPLTFDTPRPDAATLPRVPFDPAQTPRGIINMGLPGRTPGTTTLSGKGIPIANLVNMLQGYAGRTIIDKTGLIGLFDVYLEFIPQDLTVNATTPPPVVSSPADSSGPSLVTAVEEQLGLKLESARGPVEVLVIDSVGRPSEN